MWTKFYPLSRPSSPWHQNLIQALLNPHHIERDLNFSICLRKTLLLGAGREEGHKAGRRRHSEDVVVEGGEGGEQEEGKAHHEHEEHGVVVEQRECGG